jgi:RimJ/RimL family protein N-acetyltransferase
MIVFPPDTARLRFRRWTEDDKIPFREINADARVMEHFPARLEAEASDALIERINTMIDQRGFGFWAVERLEDQRFIGFIGLSVPGWDAPFMPCVEVGWRLAHAFWGQGYAPEGARAALDFGFNQLGLSEILAYTAASNLRSQRVMQKIGMQHAPEENFTHPLVPPDSPVANHVVYRLPRWRYHN